MRYKIHDLLSYFLIDLHSRVTDCIVCLALCVLCFVEIRTKYPAKAVVYDLHFNLYGKRET